MTDRQNIRPSWKERLLAVLFYFGLAPWMWRVCLRGEKRFLNAHFVQSLVIALLFVIILVYGVLVLVWASDVMADDPERFQRISETLLFQLLTNFLGSVLILVWLVAWLVAIALAAFGSLAQIPVIAWLGRRKWVAYVAFAVCSPVYFVLLAGAAVTFHATTLTDGTVRPAAAYMLYDDLGYVPKWVFDLGFYRVSLAVKKKWGRDSVVVAPLSFESLETAFQNGRFVFVASHGNDGYIDTAELHYGPENVDAEALTEDLQFVYLAACNAGERAREWKRTLAPTEVFTYGRKSYVYEHIRWLWFAGPHKIRELD